MPLARGATRPPDAFVSGLKSDGARRSPFTVPCAERRNVFTSCYIDLFQSHAKSATVEKIRTRDDFFASFVPFA
jgi:hypothetical protein